MDCEFKFLPDVEHGVVCLKINAMKQLKFHSFWLRDHCRCSDCYNASTNQRNFNLIETPLNIEPKQMTCEEDDLVITWPDGHISKYSIPWLLSINQELCQKSNVNQHIVLWNKDLIENATDLTVTFEDFMMTNGGEVKLMKSILKYGVGMVSGVVPTLNATEEVVKRIGFVQKTFFGEMWELGGQVTHSDTAYCNMYLGPHTDNTYFNEPAGLQVFHMLNVDGQGGETLLVDGFSALQRLKVKNQENFETLCTMPIKTHYVDEGVHYSSIDYVIKLDPVTNNFHHIRYNIHDRDTLLSVDFKNIMKFYKAYQMLGKELNDQSSIFKINLRPGTLLFIDNWRVLHGRMSYTGRRNLGGCYIGRSEWLSKAKVLGLMDESC